jgi:hypothetical protein
MSNVSCFCAEGVNQIYRQWGKRSKSGTGGPLHTQELVTVASFRTWRGWRECVARDRCPTAVILAFSKRSNRRAANVAPQSRRLSGSASSRARNALNHPEGETPSGQPAGRRRYRDHGSLSTTA